MYTGYEIEKGSRDKLMTLFPPKYPDVLGHHITEKFGVKDENEIPSEPESVYVIGYVDNEEDVEGFLVSIDGSAQRPDGGTYHITWSIDRSKGAKPVHTNQYIKNAEKLKRPIEIDVEPKFFSKSTDAYLKK